MTTSAPPEPKIHIPIILPEPEPKRLNPGIPAIPITFPVRTPVREPVRVRKCSN